MCVSPLRDFMLQMCRLEAQTNAINVGLSNNWVLIPESLTTNEVSFTIDPAQPTVLYRLGFTTP